MVLRYTYESATGVHVFPILPIPSLWVIPVHQPQASYILHQTWTGNSFLIWYYTCFSVIPPNRPTLSPSHSPKNCSIHLCLFCCLAYRVIITIFLNSIYICVSILYWCFSFWLTSLCIIGSSFIIQRDGIGREFRMGNTCTPMADACWCMAKPIQYCKVKIIIIIKNKKLYIHIYI